MAKVYVNYRGLKNNGEDFEGGRVMDIPYLNKDVYTEECFEHIVRSLMAENDLKNCIPRNIIIFKK